MREIAKIAPGPKASSFRHCAVWPYKDLQHKRQLRTSLPCRNVCVRPLPWEQACVALLAIHQILGPTAARPRPDMSNVGIARTESRSVSRRGYAVNWRATGAREGSEDLIDSRRRRPPGARTSLFPTGPNLSTASRRSRTLAKNKEPREASSRGSPLTGRSRNSVTAFQARQVGLEPTTFRLTAGCSTIELLPNCGQL